MAGNNRRRKSNKGKGPAKRSTGRSHSSDGPDLFGDVRRALAEPNPLGLLGYVSSLLAVTDPRRKSPFAQPDVAEAAAPTREDLVGMFIDVPEPETSALLAVIAELAGDDELLRARIRRELAARPGIEPAWLADLAQAQTYRAVRMSHVLGDGDNVMLGTRMRDGQEFTSIVYIDHNMGTLVKDAFAIPESIETIVAGYQTVTEDPDTRWDDITLADARAVVDAAIEMAAITFPPFESETWPACRPLVEWITRGLPAGGSEYQRPQWNPEDTTALADQFFASTDGAGLDDPDHRGLLESILWYGTDYGPGDPLRWSPVKVEILLDDWIPRKIIAPAEYLSLAPDLLRAFVRFVHAEVDIRPDLTKDALTAIDSWEPRYQATIRAPRPQGMDALLATLGVGPDDMGDLPFGAMEPENFAQYALDGLARDVGGPAQLNQLDDGALPDEPFGWDGIPGDVVARVQEVLELSDHCCNELLDAEYRTACRRLLARAAAADPEIFRRKGRSETAAAAVVWIIGKANDLFDQRPGSLYAKDLMSHFGVKGNVSQRAATILRAVGIDRGTYDVQLGSPDYLVAKCRRRIIEMRDRYRAG